MDMCNHKQLLSTMSMMLDLENDPSKRHTYLSFKSDEYPLVEVETIIDRQKDAFYELQEVDKAKIELGEKYLAAFGVSLICVGRDVF